MIRSLKKKISHLLKKTAGPTTVEYAFMLGLVVVLCMSTIFILSDKASNTFQKTADQLEEAEKASGS